MIELPPSVCAALEQVYAVFRRVPQPRRIDGCTCPVCLPKLDLPVLLTTPLREIPSEVLSDYATSVGFTLGSLADFKYFLPRIMEFALIDPWWFPDPDMICERLVGPAELSTWPRDEREAVAALVEIQLMTMCRNAEPYGYGVQGWFDGAQVLGVPLQRLLVELLEPAMANALIEIYEHQSAKLTRHREEYRSQPIEQDGKVNLAAWLVSDPVHAAIVKAYEARGAM